MTQRPYVRARVEEVLCVGAALITIVLVGGFCLYGVISFALILIQWLMQ